MDAEAAPVHWWGQRECRVRTWTEALEHGAREECRVRSFSSTSAEICYPPLVFNLRFFSLLLSCWGLSMYRWALMQY